MITPIGFDSESQQTSEISLSQSVDSDTTLDISSPRITVCRSLDSAGYSVILPDALDCLGLDFTIKRDGSGGFDSKITNSVSSFAATDWIFSRDGSKIHPYNRSASSPNSFYTGNGEVVSGGPSSLTSYTGLQVSPDGLYFYAAAASNRLGKYTAAGVVSLQTPVGSSNQYVVNAVNSDGTLVYSVGGSSSTTGVTVVSTTGMTVSTTWLSGSALSGIALSDTHLYTYRHSDSKYIGINLSTGSVEYTSSTTYTTPSNIRLALDPVRKRLWFVSLISSTPHLYVVDEALTTVLLDETLTGSTSPGGRLVFNADYSAVYYATYQASYITRRSAEDFTTSTVSLAAGREVPISSYVAVYGTPHNPEQLICLLTGNSGSPGTGQRGDFIETPVSSSIVTVSAQNSQNIDGQSEVELSRPSDYLTVRAVNKLSAGGNAACWQSIAQGDSTPNVGFGRHYRVQPNPGLATWGATGGTLSVTATGTTANVQDSSGEYVRYTSSAANGAIAGIRGITARNIEWDRLLTFVFKTGAVVTSTRYWVGKAETPANFSGTSTSTADTPAGSYLAFRSSDVDPVTPPLWSTDRFTRTWKFIVSNGSNLVELNTGVVLSADTRYIMQIEHTPGGLVKAYINYALVAIVTPAMSVIPATGTSLNQICLTNSLEAVAKQILINLVSIEDKTV